MSTAALLLLLLAARSMLDDESTAQGREVRKIALLFSIYYLSHYVYCYV